MRDETTIKVRDLSNGHHNGLLRLLRYLRRSESYTGVTSWRIESRCYVGSELWVTIRSRRSDCHPNSQRAVACETLVHAAIGPRAGVRVISARVGLNRPSENERTRAYIETMVRMRK